jgi:hypothetical protein
MRDTSYLIFLSTALRWIRAASVWLAFFFRDAVIPKPIHLLEVEPFLLMAEAVLGCTRNTSWEPMPTKVSAEVNLERNFDRRCFPCNACISSVYRLECLHWQKPFLNR